jgi:predicted PurR-regulated permease PerM
MSGSRIFGRVLVFLCATFGFLVIGAWRVGRQITEAIFIAALVSVWILLVVGWLSRRNDPMLASIAMVLSGILLCLLFVIPIGS